VTLNGAIDLYPSMPASLNGLAFVGLWRCPYQLSEPSTGSKGMSLRGYGDRSEECFLSFRCGMEQCWSLYKVPLRIAVMRHGPVKAY
jgi:hypothetical protein